MTITVAQNAPDWAHNLAKQMQAEIENAWTRPFQVFQVANKPDPTDPKWAWRVAGVSDGASNKKMMFCDTAAWRYFDGVAV